MSNLDFTRCSALNNIPLKKFQAKLADTFSKCEVCAEKGIKAGGASDGLCQRCSVINLAYNRYYESNIPLEYWDLKMERDFQGYEGLKKKYEEIVGDLRHNYVSGTSICFGGGHGVGKTMTVTCVLKKAAQKGFTCLYTTLSDIVNTVTQADGESKFLAKRELVMVDFLVIDEFDPRFMPSENAADLYARSLEGVFRTRASNKLPTFMCTNSPNVVQSFNGPLRSSIESLVKGYLKEFPVFGEDFRKKKVS